MNFKQLQERAKAYQEILKTFLLFMTVLGGIAGFVYSNDKTDIQEQSVGEEFVFMANEIQSLHKEIDSLKKQIEELKK